MKQHAGKPAAPTVKNGAKVRRGQMIGNVGEADLGAAIHSSIDGKVREVTEAAVVIQG
jgi:Na+-translocating ferredoxin:NAD+ oxidoreductase RnfC subunit